MSINPSGLDGIRHLPTSHLRVWIAGQDPESHYHQAAKKELARRKRRANWIRWGVPVALAALTLFLSLYRMFVQE
jgi:hypothetical protein